MAVLLHHDAGQAHVRLLDGLRRGLQVLRLPAARSDVGRLALLRDQVTATAGGSASAAVTDRSLPWRMTVKQVWIAAAMLAAWTLCSLAQDALTVEGLVREGYEVKAAFPSNAGPGLVLQKGDAVVMCFVAETKKSTDVATQYCKPVY